MFNLSFQYPIWFVLFCLFGGFVYAFILYYKDPTFLNSGKNYKVLIWSLALFRFLSVTIISILLLSPLVKSEINETEKPIIVLVQDNSESIKEDLGKDSTSYLKNIEKLVKNLSEKFTVKQYLSGENLREDNQTNFKDQSTNLSDALKGISDLYENLNLGAVILATDGIYNQGSNPLYVKSNSFVPVFTVALGDTSYKRDLGFQKLFFNPIVFLGNTFALRADVDAHYCNNENSTLSISEILPSGEKLISEQAVNINSDSYQNSFDLVLNASHEGVMHFKLRLKTLAGESNFANNVQDIFVEVKDSKEKILLLSNSPHPDVNAIKQAIESNKNYSVDVNYLSSFNNNTDEYSLVILNQIPSNTNNASSLISNLMKQNIPILFVLGSQSGLTAFNSLNNDISINGNSTVTDATPLFNKEFGLFNLSDETIHAIENFPPLKSPFGNYKTGMVSQILYYQKIGAVTTPYPLLSFNQSTQNKMGYLFGEGFWRWRLTDYQQHQNQDATNELFNRIIQYLSVRPDKNPFAVTIESSKTSGTQIFSENESIQFNATLHNETFDIVNTPDVNLIITNESGKEFPFVFSKTSSTYHLNAGVFAEGNYTWKSSVTFNNRLLNVNGKFTISPLQLESLQSRANHQLLYSISNKTGGKLFYYNQLSDLAKTISESSTIKPVIYTTHKTTPVISLIWLFIVISALITVEWFLRKLNGSY